MADVTDEDMTGVPDGRFDSTCTRFHDLDDWHPPLPPLGWYSGERCLEADVHQIIAEMVASIQDPSVDASQTCDVSDLQVYVDLVETLARQARDACVAHLSCKGAPAGCDIDPTTGLNDACTVPSAESLCDQAVLAPALAALSDLSGGPDAAQPRRDGETIVYLDDPRDCVPLLQDTDGTPQCDEGIGGDGLDDSGTGEGAGIGPFGDVDALVSCTAPAECEVSRELLRNVQDDLAVFHDEGVELEFVDQLGVGRGVQVSGLDQGEASTQLLGAVGLANDDVITHIDGDSVTSMETLERVVLELPTAPAWSLTVTRRSGSSWVSVEVSIVRGS